MSATGTTGTGDGAINNWIQFQMTAPASQALEVVSISLSAWRNGAGAPAAFKWEYSLNGGTSWDLFGSPYTESDTGLAIGYKSSSYTAAVPVTASALLLRFAPTGPTGGSGNIHINDIVVTGNVVPVPEASSALLGMLGLTALLRRRRR